MHGPLFSTITLLAELVISGIVYYTLYSGYVHNKFPTKLAFGALIYEVFFNITYMASKVPEHAKSAKFDNPLVILLAIVHGILSLIMFIALVVFFIVAWRKYKKEHNYFKDRKVLTMLFLIFWTFSIVSGVLFYAVEYLF